MFCHKCGTKIDDGAAFCYKCGTKVVPLNQDATVRKEAKEIEATIEQEIVQPIENKPVTNVPQEQSEYIDEKIWKGASKPKKALIIIVGIIVGIVLIAILKKYGAIIGGVAIVGALIYSLIKGNDQERKGARKVIIGFLIIVVIAAGIAWIAVERPGAIESTITNVVRPGASVRDAYLTKYSDQVTIEEAFSDYFENCKWDTYESGGYSYVTFKGTCMYLESKTDICITFKITGENFIVESLDINGTRQNDLILYALLASVYEDYN